MPDLNVIRDKVRTYNRARDVWNQLRATYKQMKDARDGMTLYQAGTDQEFNDAVDLLFTVAERQELAQMIGGINTLLTDWETNHADFLGLGQEEGP